MVTVSAVLTRPECNLRSIWCPNPNLPVRWVATSDLADPTPFLEGGEVLLTTGANFVTWDESSWLTYISRLKDKRIAALGIAVGLGFSTVPTSAINAAKQCNFNLFEVPEPIPFVLITRVVAKMLDSEEQTAQRLYLRANRAISQASQQFNAVVACMKTLAFHVGFTCAIVRPSGRVITVARPLSVEEGGGLDASQALGDTTALRRVLQALTRQSMTHEGAFWAYRLQESGHDYSALVCVTNSALASWQNDVLSSTSLLLSVLLHAQRQGLANTKMLLGRAIECFEAGDLHSGTVLTTSALPECAPLRGTQHAAIITNLPGMADDERARVDTYDAIVDSLLSNIVKGSFPLLCRIETQRLILVFSHSALPLMSALLQKTCHKEGLACAVGTHVAAQHISQSLTSAQAALRYASETTPFVTWKDSTSGGLAHLVGYEQTQALAADLKRRLGDDELLKTLDVFIQCNGMRAHVATQLNLHRNTVTSRLQKIEQRLDVSLDEPGVRAYLWVALTATDL